MTSGATRLKPCLHHWRSKPNDDALWMHPTEIAALHNASRLREVGGMARMLESRVETGPTEMFQ